MIDMVMADVPDRDYKVWAKIEDDLSLTIGVWKIKDKADELAIENIEMVSAEKADARGYDYFKRIIKALDLVRKHHPSFYSEIITMLKANQIYE